MGGFRFWEASEVKLIDLDLAGFAGSLTAVRDKAEAFQPVQRSGCSLVVHVAEISDRCRGRVCQTCFAGIVGER